MQELATGYGLIEGPTWDETRGLLFSDVINGGIRALSPSGEISVVVPKRRGVGGIALHSSGGLIAGGKNVIYQDFDGTPATTLLDSDVTEEAIGFNDLTTDLEGRIWVGSLAFRPLGSNEDMRPGHLHVIDLDGSVRTVSDGVTLTNGLGFSPDGRTLYHSDSRIHTVRAYDVDSSGGISPWRSFARVHDGIPDGLAVGEDGSVWVAVADGGRVAVFEPDGRLREEIPVPLPMVTSVCFGGTDRKDLYVVTGSRGGRSDHCGSIFKLQTTVAGLPLSPAQVRIGA